MFEVQRGEGGMILVAGSKKRTYAPDIPDPIISSNYVNYSPGDLQTATGRTHPRLHGMANSPVLVLSHPLQRYLLCRVTRQPSASPRPDLVDPSYAEKRSRRLSRLKEQSVSVMQDMSSSAIGIGSSPSHSIFTQTNDPVLSQELHPASRLSS
ncbi:hypothetical protein BDR04DRAFT_1163934 [Suillus decipiens]|nr:hypothetical protein BDR04DRAFT_1163934 [Suillus decipiens]